MNEVTITKEGNLAIITIDRPEALNALNTKILKDLEKCIVELENDKEIYVVLITGSGRAFVAGADISEMFEYSSIEGKEFSRYGNEVFYKLENMSKPTIAVINGFALGGGCELCMACDIRVASENAKFGLPETGLGVIPGFGGTQRLPRLVGSAKALELIYTAEVINADEAKEIGLISYIHPEKDLMEKAKILAKRICMNAQVAVRQGKRSIRIGMQSDMQTATAFEAEAFGVTFGTEDKKEGMRAFLEKRKEKHFIGK